MMRTMLKSQDPPRHGDRGERRVRGQHHDRRRPARGGRHPARTRRSTCWTARTARGSDLRDRGRARFGRDLRERRGGAPGEAARRRDHRGFCAARRGGGARYEARRVFVDHRNRVRDEDQRVEPRAASRATLEPRDGRRAEAVLCARKAGGGRSAKAIVRATGARVSTTRSSTSSRPGIVLLGPEVKSLREGRANLVDSYAPCGAARPCSSTCTSAPTPGRARNPDPRRERRLLLHKQRDREARRAASPTRASRSCRSRSTSRRAAARSSSASRAAARRATSARRSASREEEREVRARDAQGRGGARRRVRLRRARGRGAAGRSRSPPARSAAGRRRRRTAPTRRDYEAFRARAAGRCSSPTTCRSWRRACAGVAPRLGPRAAARVGMHSRTRRRARLLPLGRGRLPARGLRRAAEDLARARTRSRGAQIPRTTSRRSSARSRCGSAGSRGWCASRRAPIGARSAHLVLRLTRASRSSPTTPSVQVLGTTPLGGACRVARRRPGGRTARRASSRCASSASTWPTSSACCCRDQVERIALHEIGHALGMRTHSPIPADLMYPVVRDRAAERRARRRGRELVHVALLAAERHRLPRAARGARGPQRPRRRTDRWPAAGRARPARRPAPRLRDPAPARLDRARQRARRRRGRRPDLGLPGVASR